MGSYQYTAGEKDVNKVLKYQQEQLNDMAAQLKQGNASLVARIKDSEELLQSLGYTLPQAPRKYGENNAAVPVPVTESWGAIVAQAEKQVTDAPELEDFLTEAEFQQAYRDLERIDEEFQKCTGLNTTDTAVLLVAAAMQTLRWVLTPKIGEPYDPSKRLTDKEGDAHVKKYKDAFVEKHKRTGSNPGGWAAEKKSQGHRMRQSEGKTWIEIIESGVPYDTIKGTAALGLGIGGTNHRCKTLGHDPILGWVFGTANILTNTMTLSDLRTYRVEKGYVQPPLIPLPLLIEETAGRIQADPHLLPAALFRQAVHYASDLFTKEGLPVPLLGSFHETLAGELYASQYDFLCFARDAGLESASAVLSILINMVIGLLHGLYYNEERDGERKLYEVRTRKILLYANMLSAAGNTAVAAFTKDAKLLDIGGLVVTVSRLYTDSRFIARAKEEFIQQYLDEEWRRIEKDADDMLYIL